MPSYTLPRSHDRAIKFDGEILDSVDNTPDDKKKMTRWYNFTLYRTDGGAIVLQVEYFTCSKFETPRQWVIVATDIADLIAQMDEFGDDEEFREDDPPYMEPIQWWPEPNGRLRNDAIERALRSQWFTSLSSLFATLGDVEVVA